MISMRVLFALLVSLLGLTVTLPALAAADPEFRSEPSALEDKSCFAVNRAYEKMHNSGRFGSKIYQLMSTGDAELYSEFRIVDGYYYDKSGYGAWKGGWRVPLRTPFDDKSSLRFSRLAPRSGTISWTDGQRPIMWPLGAGALGRPRWIFG